MKTLLQLEKENEKLRLENQRLKQLAYTDKLTGCFNRSWFYENVFDSSDVYLTVADINCLRTINFVMGHGEGDKLIFESVEIFRKYGDVVRQGGDEFVIVSYNKKDFEELNSITSNKFSLGGCYKPKNMEIAKAIKMADRRLYENKKYNKSGGSYEE